MKSTRLTNLKDTHSHTHVYESDFFLQQSTRYALWAVNICFFFLSNKGNSVFDNFLSFFCHMKFLVKRDSWSNNHFGEGRKNKTRLSSQKMGVGGEFFPLTITVFTQPDAPQTLSLRISDELQCHSCLSWVPLPVYHHCRCRNDMADGHHEVLLKLLKKVLLRCKALQNLKKKKITPVPDAEISNSPPRGN